VSNHADRRLSGSAPPAEDVSPELQRVFTQGLPATLDGNAQVREALRNLVAGIIDERQAIQTRSAALFEEWCALPNVTLEQASWLLLECDPWQPRASDGTPADELQRRHSRVRNRLECEAGRALAPLKRYVEGLPRRFHLQDITRVAQAVDVQPIAAAMLAEIHSKVGRGDEGSKASLQRLRMDERMHMHRLLVQQLASRSPPQAIPLREQARPSARTRARRKYSGAPVNYQIIGMTQDEYCKVFRQEMQRSGVQAWWAAREALVDDCRALNITFAKHRPKGSKDRRPRRRVRP
jgi:hypothetical protein